MRLIAIGIALLFSGQSAGAAVADSRPVAAPLTLTYADLADLAVAAPVAAHVRIRQAARLTGAQAAGVSAGMTRFFVEADIVALLRAPASLPARVRYLADLPILATGRPPRIARKADFMVFGAAVPGRPGELRLAAPDAQIPWSAAEEARVRALLKEAMAADAAPRIAGIGKAFHVPGTLPGESETQLFLLTDDNRPVSLSVLRRPGQQPRWAVALGEIVDEAAEPPRPDSLLWYRLACNLPRSLPALSLADSDPATAAAIRADYGMVIEQLGTCVRTRRAR